MLGQDASVSYLIPAAKLARDQAELTVLGCRQAVCLWCSMKPSDNADRGCVLIM